MAVGGVRREPVSASNSLIYGKVQGTSTDSARLRAECARIPERSRTLRLEFPASWNRELMRGEQGIFRQIREALSATGAHLIFSRWHPPSAEQWARDAVFGAIRAGSKSVVSLMNGTGVQRR